METFKRLHVSIKDWYVSAYPADDEGEELNKDATFADVVALLFKGKGDEVYELIGTGESDIREAVFDELSNILSVDYEVVYNYWLNGHLFTNKSFNDNIYKFKNYTRILQ